MLACTSGHHSSVTIGKGHEHSTCCTAAIQNIAPISSSTHAGSMFALLTNITERETHEHTCCHSIERLSLVAEEVLDALALQRGRDSWRQRMLRIAIPGRPCRDGLHMHNLPGTCASSVVCFQRATLASAAKRGAAVMTAGDAQACALYTVASRGAATGCHMSCKSQGLSEQCAPAACTS